MESSLTAPFRGRVKRCSSAENVHVAAQAPLVALEPLDGTARSPPAASGCRSRAERPTTRWRPSAATRTCGGCSGSCSATTSRRRDVERMIADLHGECADLLACDPTLVPGEHRLLRMFADLRALSRSRRVRGRRASRSCCRARRSTSTRGCARSTPRPRGCRPGSSTQLRARSGALRDRQPRAHARARGGVLPPVPLRAAGRDGARGDRGDPRPPPRGGRGARGTRRRRLPRGARPAGARARGPRPDRSPTSRARSASATSTSRSSPPPASASTPRWRRTSPRSPPTRSGRTATS